MIEWFSRMFGSRAEKMPRLTSEEAERIAHAAAAGSRQLARLSPGVLERTQGRLVWRFHTGTRGSWLAVDVDDATGEATVDEMQGR
jgi:hypothetical protein